MKTLKGSDREDVLKNDDFWDSALMSAEGLCRILKKEKEALKQTSVKEILELLGHKEFLVQEMKTVLDIMKENPLPSQDERVQVLKTRLTEIKRLNDTNRSFVEGFLQYWEDFTQVFILSAYNARASRTSSGKGMYPRGLSLYKEA